MLRKRACLHYVRASNAPGLPPNNAQQGERFFTCASPTLARQGRTSSSSPLGRRGTSTSVQQQRHPALIEGDIETMPASPVRGQKKTNDAMFFAA